MLHAKFLPRSKHSVSVIKTNQLLLYKEIIGVGSEIHRKHINKAELCYRLRSYLAEDTFLCIYVAVYESPISERYSLYDLRIFLCYFISL
jgi:hypothetical protein